MISHMSLIPDTVVEMCPIWMSNIGLYVLKIVFYWYLDKYKLKSMLEKESKILNM